MNAYDLQVRHHTEFADTVVQLSQQLRESAAGLWGLALWGLGSAAVPHPHKRRVAGAAY